MVRSGFVESRHRGTVVVIDAAGDVARRHGPVEEPFFPRSAVKPLQAAAMVAHGLDLDGELLALAAASHSGAGYHVAGARRILAGAGLGPDALRCPPALPLDEQAAREVLRAGGGPDRLTMNCSGKHAAMLATAVAAGWPVEDYRDPGHPVQVAIREAIEEYGGEPVARTGVDGCGAALYAISPLALARGLRALVLAPAGSPGRRVVDAMRAHPEWTSGGERAECRLMRAVPGLLVKAGAEGVMAMASPDGSAAVLKVEDGARRAQAPAAVAVLRELGPAGPDLDAIGTAPVFGGGRPVGEIRPARLPRPG